MPIPFRIGGRVHAHDFAQGAVVEGIPSEPGFSHVSIVISNETGETITGIDATLRPNDPTLIAKSAVSCQFAECRIGPLLNPPVMFSDRAPTGELVPIPGAFRVLQSYHRLVAERLPPHSVVFISLATMVPASPGTRVDPNSVRVDMGWIQDGAARQAQWEVPLRPI
jgi:hypothetical protein